ncbi:ABC transporter permease [Mucilaginibacter xinganensis]|nr:ABC transporter permease [Mucilaginibacter xinganensis]
MIKNYLKIAIRQLRKQKMYAAIKVGGFALGITACLLIGLYIMEELNYDKSYPDTARIYRILSTVPIDGKVQRGPSFPAPFSAAVKSNFPEVEKSARIMASALFDGAGSNELRRADRAENNHEEGFAYTDQALLDMLKLPMVYGDRSNALAEPFTMVITKKKADKYFPGINPVGKIMYLNNDTKQPYKIGGVIQDFPSTSHLQFDFFLTMTGKELWRGEQTDWAAFNYDTYILLKPGTNIAMFQKKLTNVTLNNYIIPGLLNVGFKAARTLFAHATIDLQPISDIHLKSYDIPGSHGDIRFIWLFGAVAGFILVIACINFVNLSTAKSANRAKEVGLRKVVGSTRVSLIKQFLTESMLFSFLSFALGTILALGLLPYFNILAGKSLTIPWGSPWLIPIIVIAAFIIGIIAGVYPAFYLSAFKPASVLKGSISSGSKNSVLRNGLVVFQFTTSVILIICTIVVYNQMQFILNKDLGYDKNQVVVIQGANILGNDVKNFKNELLKISSVKSASISDYLPVEGTKRNGNTFTVEGREKIDAGVGGQSWVVDNDYLKTMGLKLAEGRNFDPAVTTDSTAIIINETLAKKLNIKHPLGTKITNTGTIIGVVKDFNFESLRDPIGGLVLHWGISPSIVTVKVNAAKMQSTMASISATWKKFSPSEPVRYTFLDERFIIMYADVQRMGHIFTSFAILAIIIACLGLFALAAFMAEQRSKEIGIRKVLGASVESITRLLSVDFIKLVALSIVIASPIAWWAMNKWLQDFTYRTTITWWIFAAAGLVAIVIALATVSFQSIKAAIANPIKALKSE